MSVRASRTGRTAPSEARHSRSQRADAYPDSARPRRISAFRWRVEWVAAGLVVGDVDHADDLRHVLAQQRLDALPHGHRRQATALAAALKAQLDHAVDHVDELHPPTVVDDRRIHLLIEHPADPLGK